MILNESEIALEKTHEALNDLLTLYILKHGYDSFVVDRALKALARNLNLTSRKSLYLPITAVFWDKVEVLANGS